MQHLSSEKGNPSPRNKPRIGYVIGNHTDGRDMRMCARFSHSDVTFVGRVDGNDRAMAARAAHDIRIIEPEAQKVIPDRWNRMSNGRYDITAWVYLKDLEQHLADVDVIYTAGTYTALGVQCARIAKKLRKPLVIFEWETVPHHLTTWLPPYALWTRVVKKNADRFIAMTDRAHAYLASIGVPEQKRVTVYPSVDTTLFSPQSVEHDIIRILFVGRLTAEKGLMELLEAFDRVQATCPKTELWICGRGDMEGEVADAAKKLPIVYKGFVTNEQVRNFFHEVDIFCLPSKDRNWGPIKIWEEQFGFVFVEAMASGLPVVTTDNGAIPEVVGRDNAITRQGDIDGLAEKLVELIRNRERRTALGVANRNRAATFFNDNKQVALLEKEILSVL